jgi:transcriptional regulator with XRE-family HTH domain
MDDIRVGGAFRAIRVRHLWRQEDVATRSGVSRSEVSLIERGHIDRVSLATLRKVGASLDIRVDVVPRWRGGELDRLLNSAHSALHEEVAGFLERLSGWQFAPEVSFSIYGERGVIDILAWHPPSRTLLVIELKTEILDVQELMGTLDRKRRLARRVAAERGWHAETVSCWVIVADSRTNRRRVEAHRTTLRAAFPADGRTMHDWLRRPVHSVAGLSMWPDVGPRRAGRALPARTRVRVRRAAQHSGDVRSRPAEPAGHGAAGISNDQRLTGPGPPALRGAVAGNRGGRRVRSSGAAGR